MSWNRRGGRLQESTQVTTWISLWWRRRSRHIKGLRSRLLKYRTFLRYQRRSGGRLGGICGGADDPVPLRDRLVTAGVILPLFNGDVVGSSLVRAPPSQARTHHLRKPSERYQNWEGVSFTPDSEVGDLKVSNPIEPPINRRETDPDRRKGNKGEESWSIFLGREGIGDGGDWVRSRTEVVKWQGMQRRRWVAEEGGKGTTY